MRSTQIGAPGTVSSACAFVTRPRIAMKVLETRCSYCARPFQVTADCFLQSAHIVANAVAIFRQEITVKAEMTVIVNAEGVQV